MLLHMQQIKRKNRELMHIIRKKLKAYRTKQKQTQQQITNTKATILQNAIRNKLARNALSQQKQNKANEVVSKINQKKTITN